MPCSRERSHVLAAMPPSLSDVAGRSLFTLTPGRSLFGFGFGLAPPPSAALPAQPVVPSAVSGAGSDATSPSSSALVGLLAARRSRTSSVGVGSTCSNGERSHAHTRPASSPQTSCDFQSAHDSAVTTSACFAACRSASACAAASAAASAAALAAAARSRSSAASRDIPRCTPRSREVRREVARDSGGLGRRMEELAETGGVGVGVVSVKNVDELGLPKSTPSKSRPPVGSTNLATRPDREILPSREMPATALSVPSVLRALICTVAQRKCAELQIESG